MSIRKTIIVRWPNRTNDVGDPIPDTAEKPPREITGCKIWPRQSTETEDRGTILIAGWNVFTPPWPEKIPATVTVELDGDQYEVDGEPGFYEGKGIWLVLKKVGT